MNTAEVKAYLAELYPHEAFKRLLKVEDSEGNVHRVMESAQTMVVVTISVKAPWVEDNTEVGMAPTTAELKDPSRPWKPK